MKITKNEDGVMTIILNSGAMVHIDDSLHEEEGQETILIKSYPEETVEKGIGYGDVDMQIVLEDQELVTDLVSYPNIEARKRLNQIK